MPTSSFIRKRAEYCAFGFSCINFIANCKLSELAVIHFVEYNFNSVIKIMTKTIRNIIVLLLCAVLHCGMSYRCCVLTAPQLTTSSAGWRGRTIIRNQITMRSIIDTQAEEVPSPQRPPEPKSIFLRIWNETKNYLLQFRQTEFRKRFSVDIRYIFSSAYNNIREGELGKRGEELFAAQLLLVTFVLFGVPMFVSFSLKLVGIVATSGGLYFISRGVWDLRQNLTPFVSPISGNQLVTTGIYGVVRHPLYTGLISLCLGVSIFSDSVDKAVLTVFLAFFLDKKADREEELLKNVHPITYSMYVQTTKKLLPTIY